MDEEAPMDLTDAVQRAQSGVNRHDSELDKHRKRLDNLEDDHWKWLGVEDERTQARRDLLGWALICAALAAYLIMRAYYVDRAPVPGKS